MKLDVKNIHPCLIIAFWVFAGVMLRVIWEMFL